MNACMFMFGDISSALTVFRVERRYTDSRRLFQCIVVDIESLSFLYVLNEQVDLDELPAQALAQLVGDVSRRHVGGLQQRTRSQVLLR